MLPDVPTIRQTRRSDLHPLATTQNHRLGRRPSPLSDLTTHPLSKRSASPTSAISLASPSLRAVRQYYIDNGLLTAFQARSPSHDPRISWQQQQDFPRRHSMVSPSGLLPQLGNFNVSTPVTGRPSPLSRDSLSVADDSSSIASTSRQMLLKDVNRNELAVLENSLALSRRRSVIDIPIPNKIPAEYTYNRFLEWGRVYLGNAETADAFVRAVHLRKPHPVFSPSDSTSSTNTASAISDVKSVADDSGSESSNGASSARPAGNGNNIGIVNDEVVIRARILPSTPTTSSGKDRKPFLMERTFNISELRATATNSKIRTTHAPSLPSVEREIIERRDSKMSGMSSDSGMGDPDENGSRDEKRQITIRPKSGSSQGGLTIPSGPGQQGPYERLRSGRLRSGRAYVAEERRIMPIHIEYVLHHLPILAALMLSGHVQKGDGIDLPLPRPEAWQETVAWIYTGSDRAGGGEGKVSGAVRENVLYLAGSVD